MANVNSVTVSGNLTRDPEVRWLAEDGKSAIVNIGIAVNESRWDKEKEEYVETVSFFDADVFGGFAVVVARKMRKADAATIQGKLKQETWESESGKNSKVLIVAQQIDSEAFFRSKDEDNAVAVGSSAPQAAAAPAPAAEPAPAAAPAADDIPF